MTEKKVPLLLKCIFGLFLAVMVPVYWIKYGPANFLWFSDVTLFLAFFAVLTEKRLLASMAAVGGLVLESFWNVNYFLQLLFGYRLSTLTDYMFNSSLPLWLRGISLFHVALPPLVFWLIFRLGYDKRALFFQTAMSWCVVMITWLVTNPEKNINWVFSYKKMTKINMQPLAYIFMELAVLAVVFTLTHSFLALITRKKVLT